MKVYFSVMGIGFGHITRCLSIARILREKGVECHFSTYNRATELPRREGYKTYDSKSLMWYEDESGRLDFERTMLKSPLIFNRLFGHFLQEHKNIMDIKPDVIVCDSRYATVAASKKVKTPRVYITNQPRIFMPRKNNGNGNVNGPLEHFACAFNYNLLDGQNSILLPDFPMPDSISHRHMTFKSNAPKRFIERTHFVGPISYNRPGSKTPEEVEEACSRYDVEPGKFTYIALSGPAEMGKKLNDAILNYFPTSNTPSIMANGRTNSSRLKKDGNLRIVDGWIEDRDALFEAADAIVCRAGLSTLSEIVSFGKKALVIPQANQPEQESNAAGIEKLGLARSISLDDLNPQLLGKTLETIRESEDVAKAAGKAKEMAAHWNGESNSAKVIMNLLDAN